jgi:hypothetical protein
VKPLSQEPLRLPWPSGCAGLSAGTPARCRPGHQGLGHHACRYGQGAAYSTRIQQRHRPRATPRNLHRLLNCPTTPSDLPAESSHRRAILGRRGAKRQLWVPVPPLPLPFGVPRMFPRDRLGSTERQGRSRQRLSVSFLPVRVVRPCTLNTRRDLKGTLAKLG